MFSLDTFEVFYCTTFLDTLYIDWTGNNENQHDDDIDHKTKQTKTRRHNKKSEELSTKADH